MAPLAPTEETGPKNLADPLFLQALYDAGVADSFDIVAAKPYGFDTGPEDRRVSIDRLNFSRVILLREVMEQNGESDKAIWAGNWGWNSLPDSWQGLPSIWGQVDEKTQAEWTISGLNRARQEWPWMGLMFLENWEPVADNDDPRWGFSIAGRLTEDAIQTALVESDIAYPGFHLANDEGPAQNYNGNWRFSPEFGADIGQTGDWVAFDFWGTDAGLRVRRTDFNARFFVEVDGKPANALPLDKGRASLVLSSPDPAEDYIAIEKVTENLTPGQHTMTVTADRGWDQWALNGFSVGFKPSDTAFMVSIVLLSLFALACLILAFITGRKTNWGVVGKSVTACLGRLNNHSQLALTAISAALIALTGWLTWGEQAAGVYRRLGDGGQLALTAAAASVFYATPFFVIYLAALAIFFLLVFMRPAWGLAIVAFAIPYYVNPKPFMGYRFSPVEIFLLVTLLARHLNRFHSPSISLSPVPIESRPGHCQSYIQPNIGRLCRTGLYICGDALSPLH
jgi:hypothetical protein